MRKTAHHLHVALCLLGLGTTLSACSSSTEPTPYQWAGVYTTGTKFGGATGTWNASSPLEVTTDRRVIRGTTQIVNPTIGENTISWTIADGNSTNATLNFMASSSSTYFWTSPVTGKLFQGSIQSPGSGPVDFKGIVP